MNLIPTLKEYPLKFNSPPGYFECLLCLAYPYDPFLFSFQNDRYEFKKLVLLLERIQKSVLFFSPTEFLEV